MPAAPQQHDFQDFNSFPPAVKRKCFSSLERLRLAQQRPASSETRTTPASFSCSPGATRPASRASRPRLLNRHSSYFKAKLSSPSDCFSFEEAIWFQRLPDKVQQKHFTREEQRALSGHRESPIFDAADEVLLRARRQRTRSVPTVPTSPCSSTSSVHTLEDDPEHPVDMDDSILDSFRWMDDDDDLDLTLDDYHSHLISSAEPASPHHSRRPSFRRSPSCTGLPQGDTPLTAFIESTARSTAERPASPQDPRCRDNSPSRTGNREVPAATQSTAKSTDPSTKHYQDPEARLKLRVYLASPSKFDEALEFGFPSLESTEHLPQPRRPSLSRTYNTEPAPRTFYDSESPSFLDHFDSDSDDAESLPEMDTPNTPSDAMFFRNTHRLPGSKSTSSDVDRPSSKLAPKLNFKTSEALQSHRQPYVVTGCSREMTLRMTLTRPDLRASEDLLYGSGDNDPLALEHLPSPVAGNDIWDQRKDGGGTVRKLWRRVSGR